MSRSILVEYEIYLPLRYNNGRPIPRNYLKTVFREIAERFGGESHNFIDKIQGRERVGRVEPFCRVWVHANNSLANDKWFRQYKGILKKRFKQREIYITKKWFHLTIF